MPDSPAVVLLSEADREGAWGRLLEATVGEARAEAEAILGVHLVEPPGVISYYPEEAFYEALGYRPHRVLAVAQAPPDHRVVINKQRFLAQSPLERRRTLVHEFVHLILDERVPGAVPRWLHEGLAMIVAGEDSFQYSIRVAAAASFGGLVPLDRLFSGPGGAEADQELAYAESLSATRFLLKSRAARMGRGEPDPGRLVQTLADPERGEPLRQLLNDPGYIRAFEREWRASLRSFWSWVAALSTGGVMWVAVSALFLFAYWRKKRMAEAVAQTWDEDERRYGEVGTEWSPEDHEEEYEEWMR